MTEVTRFSPNVVLVESAFVREILGITRSYLQKKGIACPELDFARWLSILAIDGGFTSEVEEKKSFDEIQVVIVQEAEEDPIPLCYPQSFGEIDCMDAMTLAGPMHFNVVKTENMLPSKDLFLDLMEWVVAAPEVKHVLLLPSMNLEDEVPDALRGIMQRMKLENGSKFGNVTCVHMGKTEDDDYCHHVTAFFSIMMALGIDSEKL